MTEPLFSASWATAWRDALNRSAAYRAAAADWCDSLVVTLRPDPGLGVPRAQSVFLDLLEGECREARPATPADFEAADFVIEAAPSVWKDVLGGTLAPLTALALGRLRLAKGSMADLLPFVAAARELVAAASSLDTEYPEGWE